MKIQMDIKDCSQCPNFTSDRVYYADSWDCGDSEWICKKLNRKIGVADIHHTPKIPKDCPIKA